MDNETCTYFSSLAMAVIDNKQDSYIAKDGRGGGQEKWTFSGTHGLDMPENRAKMVGKAK